MYRAQILLAFAGTAVANPPAWPLSCRSSESVGALVQLYDLHGQVFVTTGGDGNIATELNKALAKVGATVVLGCRNMETCNATRAVILAEPGVEADRVETAHIDLSSKSSIADFATVVASRHSQLHALVHLAGTSSSTHMTQDGFNLMMEVNLLGPALLTDLLLPLLRADSTRPPGRVVNVAADVASSPLADDVTVADLVEACRSTDSALLDFGVSKLLLANHAFELAIREPGITAFAVNPNYAVMAQPLPQWLYSFLLRSPLPKWTRLLKLMGLSDEDIGFIHRGHIYCTTTFHDLDRCPASYAGAAAVVAAAVVTPDVEIFSGSWLDYEAKPTPTEEDPTDHQLLEPTCMPRPGPYMNVSLRSSWFDVMLELMRSNATAVTPTRTIPTIGSIATALLA